jgi:hypothetical protein
MWHENYEIFGAVRTKIRSEIFSARVWKDENEWLFAIGDSLHFIELLLFYSTLHLCSSIKCVCSELVSCDTVKSFAAEAKIVRSTTRQVNISGVEIFCGIKTRQIL